MHKFVIDRLRILTQKPVPWWWRVAYLIPDVLQHHNRIEQYLVKGAGSDRVLNKVIDTHLNAYIQKGTLPPAEIAGPIINMAEDLAAGRQVTLRAGDYIALQNFARPQK